MQQEENNHYLPALTIVKVYEYKFKVAQQTVSSTFQDIDFDGS